MNYSNDIDISTRHCYRYISHNTFQGAGKTTLLRRTCESFLQQEQHIPCYGFYTEEIRGNNGLRIGFDVVTLDGNSRASLSRIEDAPIPIPILGLELIGIGIGISWNCEYTTSRSSPSSLPRVGLYNVFVDEFERIALSLLTNIQTPCICFIDEIGKMELLSKKFKDLIQTLIERRNLILIATIPIKPLTFVDKIRTRKDCHLITVTRDNRSGSTLQNELMAYIEKLTKTIT
ncbi:unnamed protein product [Rotaria sordida]|uniref:Uncharacterized protein n=1 Tax=Rotaria sordida TaxID=392033 RepID=A0A814LEI8_9BILA|nr:unnamed protein product [Rotaria sordida]CAF3639321.1 unnamed protein product [Rotaria sordida]